MDRVGARGIGLRELLQDHRREDVEPHHHGLGAQLAALVVDRAEIEEEIAAPSERDLALGEPLDAIVGDTRAAA